MIYISSDVKNLWTHTRCPPFACLKVILDTGFSLSYGNQVLHKHPPLPWPSPNHLIYTPSLTPALRTPVIKQVSSDIFNSEYKLLLPKRPWFGLAGTVIGWVVPCVYHISSLTPSTTSWTCGTGLMDTLNIVPHKLESCDVAYAWPHASSFVQHHSNPSANSNLPTTKVSLVFLILLSRLLHISF